MTLTSEFKQHIIASHAEALRALIAANPNMTAKALRGLIADHPELGAVTLGELVGETKRPKASKAKGPRKAAKAGKTRGRKKAWNVRSPAGRAALEAAVLEALGELGGKDVAAGAVRKKLGATPAQIRTTLNRQIDAGAVTFTGKARGTRYSLA